MAHFRIHHLTNGVKGSSVIEATDPWDARAKFKRMLVDVKQPIIKKVKTCTTPKYTTTTTPKRIPTGLGLNMLSAVDWKIHRAKCRATHSAGIFKYVIYFKDDVKVLVNDVLLGYETSVVDAMQLCRDHFGANVHPAKG